MALLYQNANGTTAQVSICVDVWVINFRAEFNALQGCVGVRAITRRVNLPEA